LASLPEGEATRSQLAEAAAGETNRKRQPAAAAAAAIAILQNWNPTLCIRKV
jgi:hypothetical protein